MMPSESIDNPPERGNLEFLSNEFDFPHDEQQRGEGDLIDDPPNPPPAISSDEVAEMIRVDLQREAKQYNGQVKQKAGGQAADQEEPSWFFSALENSGVGRFLDEPPPPIDWISDNSLPAKTVGLLVGPGAAGKSTLAILMMFAVATGKDILPEIFTPTQPGKVLGVFGEDDELILHHRIYCLARQVFGSDPKAFDLLRQNMQVVATTGQDIRFMVGSTAQLMASDFFSDVFRAISEISGLRLIVLDPVSRLEGADENDNAAGTYFISLLERIAQQTGAAVIATHHVAKRAGVVGGGEFDLAAAMSQDVARGASGLTNGARWQANLFGLPEKTARKVLGLTTTLPGQYLAFRVSKKNYGPPEDVHFLERKSGGLLIPCSRVENRPPQEVEELLKGLLLDAVFQAEGKQLTQRLLIDAHAKAWKKTDSRITRTAIQQTIAACLLNGELHERTGINVMGKKITCLSRYPKTNTEDSDQRN